MLARVGDVVFDLDAVARVMTLDARAQYLSTPLLPSIYDVPMRYAPPGDLADAATTIARGWGGCLSLAAARVGELLSRGELARVAVAPTARGLHAFVDRVTTWEDPSRMVTLWPQRQ